MPEALTEIKLPKLWVSYTDRWDEFTPGQMRRASDWGNTEVFNRWLVEVNRPMNWGRGTTNPIPQFIADTLG